MEKYKAIITGIGAYWPEDLITNADLEKMVDTSDEWIMTRVGIKQRHIMKDPSKASAWMGARAVEELLEKTNTKPEEIDLVICSTVTPDMHFPATATIISDMVGIKDAFSFDLNAGCSGFVYGITTASQFIETGRYKKVILVAAEKMTAITDYTDRKTCPLFGDAASAILLEPTTENLGVIDHILRADGIGVKYLHMKAGGSLNPASPETLKNKEHFIYQDGAPVFKHAVSKMADTAAELLEKNKLTADDIAWLVPHQANLRIIDATSNRLGLDNSKVMINIERFGNTTAATIPLCLYEWENKLKKGDNIILAAFGAGFTWGAVYLKWAYDPK